MQYAAGMSNHVYMHTGGSDTEIKQYQVQIDLPRRYYYCDWRMEDLDTSFRQC